MIDWRDVADERDPRIALDRELLPRRIGAARADAPKPAPAYTPTLPLVERRALAALRQARKAKAVRL